MKLNDLFRRTLINKWKSLIDSMYLKPLEPDEFKCVFKETWMYFIDIVKNASLVPEDIEIINIMNYFNYIIYCPAYDEVNEIADKNNLWALYYTCTSYVNVLLENIYKKDFASGELVKERGVTTTIVYLDGFDIIFNDDVRELSIKSNPYWEE